MAANAVALVIGGYHFNSVLNSKVSQGGIYPHIKFERDMLNIFRVRVFTSSGSTGGGRGDAKTIISPNTSFGDIITIMFFYMGPNVNVLAIRGGGGAWWPIHNQTGSILFSSYFSPISISQSTYKIWKHTLTDFLKVIVMTMEVSAYTA